MTASDSSEKSVQALWQQIVEDDTEREISHKLRDFRLSLLEGVRARRIKPADMIQAMNYLVKSHPELNSWLLGHMEYISDHSKHNRGYAFPEFFWIVIQSDIPKHMPIIDLINCLSSFTPRDTLRAYLNYLWITDDTIEKYDLLFAYYYVGHTVDSLRLVTESISLDEPKNQRVFADAIALVVRQESFTAEDISFLTDLFKQGLNASDSNDRRYSEMGLQKLAVMKQQNSPDENQK